MSITRRGFIGSVIGAYVGSKIPFRVIGIKQPMRSNSPVRTRLKMFGQNQNELRNYRVFYINNEGYRFYAPDITKIDFTENHSGINVKFLVDKIQLQKAVTVLGAGLISDEGYLIQESNFASPIHLMPNDELNLTFEYKVNL